MDKIIKESIAKGIQQCKHLVKQLNQSNYEIDQIQRWHPAQHFLINRKLL
jgi:hypothetical protein